MWMRVGLVWLVFVGVASADEGGEGLGSKDPGLFNLKGQIYYLPKGTPRLPNALEKRKADGVIYAEKLDVPPRVFTAGFPGVTDRFEWFAIVYAGRFQTTVAGRSRGLTQTPTPRSRSSPRS